MTFFYIAIGLMAAVVVVVLMMSVALAIYILAGFCALIAALTRSLTGTTKEIL